MWTLVFLLIVGGHPVTTKVSGLSSAEACRVAAARMEGTFGEHGRTAWVCVSRDGD